MGWQDAPEVKAPAWASAPEVESPSIGARVKQQAGNLVAGAVRGAGSIGATILAPIDVASDALAGKGLTLESNRKRRADMDAALANPDLPLLGGAETDSLAYGVGKLGSEIAGTLGVGGLLANGARAAGAAPNVVQALASSGMNAGTATGKANMLLRAAGGGLSGGAAAGLVNPEDAGAGAVLGAALPGTLQIAGAVGQKIGGVVRGPAQSSDLQAAIGAARGDGYVIPPSQARPSLANRLLEGFSGKITTAQNASAKNQGVTNRLAAEALGLPGETKLTTEVLDAVREDAGKAYEALRALPVKPATAADRLSNIPASPEINPASMVFDLRKARNDATAWFRSYGRTADPDALAKAQAAASKAAALEKGLEDYADSLGNGDLVQALREARTRIAKTYSVEDALNGVSGSVDARRLAAQLDKGKPLSGELKRAAEFAARFPKAAQAVEGMGSLPQSSPLDWALGGSLAAATANPLALASVAARPAARATVLSPLVQNRLIQGNPNALMQLVGSPELQQLAYRAAPAGLADRR